jgi:ABC-2 type transport system permease protein
MRSATWAIIRREYLTRVKTKGFWIATALFPLLAAGFTVLPPVMAQRAKASPEPVRIVDATGKFFPIFSEVSGRDDARGVPPVEEELIGGRSLDEVRRELNTLAERGEIQGYLVVEAEALAGGDLVYYARNPSSVLGADVLRAQLRESVIRYRLEELGVEAGAIDLATRRVGLDIRKASNDPRRQESGIAAILMSFTLVMFIYFALIFYGIYVLRGVLEEKSNRIVEVIVSSVRPFQLMMGKILGIGAVGLTQITIWVLFAAAFSAPQLAAVLSISEEFRPAVNMTALAFFPVFFVLGYFLFATVYAGIGAMFNSDEDAQQMAILPQMFLIIPMMLLLPILKNPAGPLATWMSMFPFFTPVVMYMRIAAQTPPAWQIALSIAIMIATIFVMIWIVSKVYRVGILMYGKKPTIPEVLRWLRYA